MAIAKARSGRTARVARFACWMAAFGFGLLSVAVARAEPGGSLGGTSWAASFAELAAGWGLIGAGLYLSSRRPGSPGGSFFAAAGVAWFFVEWNNPGIGWSVGFTFGLVTWALAPPLVALAVLTYPSGRLPAPFDRGVVVGALAAGGLMLGFFPTLFFDPHQQACNLCPANLLAVSSDSSAVREINRWGLQLGLLWAAGLAGLAVWHMARSSAPLRRLTAPVLIAGVAYLILVWIDFAHSLPRGQVSNDPVERRLWLGEAAALCAIALGVAWSWLRARRTRSAMARLVVDLGESTPSGGLGLVLAHALGDSELQVAYPLEGSDRSVNADGVTVELPPRGDRTTTPLVRGETMVAMLVHRKGLLDDPGLVEEVVAAARIALENERLHAQVRAQLEDLRASRARIVATGDAERRRLERDLHDGAQQRLVGLSLAVRLARAQLGPDPDPNVRALIDQADQGLRVAIDELRELAHGIYPAVLGDEGLAAAVEALVERSSIPIAIGEVVEGRYPSAVEAAAYFIIAEATGSIAVLAGACGVTIDVEHGGELLVIEVTEDGVSDFHQELEVRLVDLTDRVGALDGRLSIERVPEGAITIRAEIPCAP